MIDHSGHPHPSTPTARAACRANGGTGSTAKPKKKATAKKKTPSLTDPKVPVAKKTKKTTSVPVKKSPISAAKHGEIMDRMGDEEAQVDGLLSAPVGIDGDEDRGFKDEEEKEAAEWYIGEGYGFVNASLRGQGEATDKAKAAIKHLDAIMNRSKLTENTGVFRGVSDGRVIFGDSFDGDLTGLEWREKGYSSTTVNEDVADDFVDSDDDDDDDDDDQDGGGGGGVPVKMRIVLPKGASAFQASDVDDEAEMILARNSGFRVIADRGEDDMGVRVIDVELVL